MGSNPEKDFLPMWVLPVDQESCGLTRQLGTGVLVVSAVKLQVEVDIVIRREGFFLSRFHLFPTFRSRDRARFPDDVNVMRPDLVFIFVRADIKRIFSAAVRGRSQGVVCGREA